MKKQMGILIMRDENDILKEYLDRVINFYDKILVLDGSEDNEGQEICSKFSEVIFYEKDQNIINGFANDSIRGFLWEQAKSLVDDKEWVAVLHPDEFPNGDPLQMLDQHPDATTVCIQNLHFFLHTSQREDWSFDRGDLIEPKMKWYMAPGHPEHRYFRFDKRYTYNDQHRLVVPPQALERVSHSSFQHKQFSYRSEDQVLKRAKTRWESGWQLDDYCLVLETGDIFFDTLKYPDYILEKYPEQYHSCWYNLPTSYVAKIEE
jgi:hypothetical protein